MKRPEATTAGKVTKLLDAHTGRMACRVCGAVHYANTTPGGGFYRGAWQCRYGCELEEASGAGSEVESGEAMTRGGLRGRANARPGTSPNAEPDPESQHVAGKTNAPGDRGAVGLRKRWVVRRASR